MLNFAFKNMLRYKTRSLITLSVVAVTAITSIIAMGFSSGIVELMLKGFVQYQTAHVRAVTPEYLKEIRFRPIYYSISNVSALAEKLRSYPEVKQVVPTFTLFGFASLGGGSTAHPSRGIAIPFADNSYEFSKKLKEGSAAGGVLIGTKFSEKIGTKINSPLMISTTTVEGGINAVKPNLGGLLQFNMKAMDNNMFFLDLPLAQTLLRAPDSASEVYIHLHNESDTKAFTEKLRADFPSLAFQTYYEQIGPMASMIEIERKVTWLITTLIMMLGSLAVVNSLVAGIYDRINEIGMLKAVGFSDKELSNMLVYEGFFYGLIGGTIGFIIGAAVLGYFGYFGLDLTPMLATAELPIEPVLYPIISWQLYLLGYLISILVPALVAFLPSKHIKNITPVDALRA